MENLYEYFLEKMHTEYMIFEGTYKKLIRDDVRECFNNLVYEDKVFTINGIIDLMKKVKEIYQNYNLKKETQ